MMFLKGGHGDASRRAEWCAPSPLGAHFRHLVSSWRSWSLSWLILALSGRILPPSCSKMVPRWPNIAQHSAKMSQHSLQEQPQDPKKPSKVLYRRRCFGFRHFWPDRAQDPKRSPRCSHMCAKLAILASKLAILGTSWRQVGQLGADLGASCAPIAMSQFSIIFSSNFEPKSIYFSSSFLQFPAAGSARWRLGARSALDINK